MLSQIVDININFSTGDKNLKLIVIKRAQPVNVDHVIQTTTERLTVWSNLLHNTQSQ